MKYNLLPALLCWIASSLVCCHVSAQAGNYGNEWIDHSRPYFRIEVTDEGLHRINQSALSSALSGAGYNLSGIDPRSFQLFHLGEEQYIHIEGENDGNFDVSDYIEFFGEQKNGVLDSLLFNDAANEMLHSHFSLFNDTAVYYLTWNTSLSNRRLDNRPNDMSTAPAADPWIWYEVVDAFNNNFATFYGGPPVGEVLSSKYALGEGFADAQFNKTTKTKSLSAPLPYSGAGATNLAEFAIIGRGDVTHRTIVDINGLNYYDWTYAGYQVNRGEVALSNLAASNTFSFTAAGIDATDIQMISFVKIGYSRQPRLAYAASARFGLDGVARSNRLIQLAQITLNGQPAILHDRTNNVRMIGSGTGATASFHLNYLTREADIYVTNQTGANIEQVTELEEMNFVDFSDVANQGNFVILSHPVLYSDSLGNDWIEAYRQYRSTGPGGSYDAITVDINQLYEQFSYGVQKNPLAVRNFTRYITENFATAPEYLFIIGKGYVYNEYRRYSSYYAETMIPTFGNPGSDILLVGQNGSSSPLIPVGRLAARDPYAVKNYYDKVIQYEANINDPLQTIDNKGWMKNILHFGGGANSFEQTTFRNYLENYATTIVEPSFGGKVSSFYKTSTDPISNSPSATIDSLITTGVSIMSFFGHSSVNSFDYNIGDPNTFTNEGKYMVVYGNGCVTGEIHKAATSLSENYVMAEQKGAIAFIAASALSYASGLNTLAVEMYKQWTTTNYQGGLGESIKQAIEIVDALGSSSINQLAMEHTTLHGDPALRLNPFSAPDYAIEASSVSFDPAIVTLGIDSFDIEVIVSNIGMAIDSNYFVEVERTLPGGESVTLSERVSTPYYQDTLRFTLPVDPINGVGINSFSITVDKQDEISELDELNNILQADLLIASDDAIPVVPYEFSIQSEPVPALQASTADLFAEAQSYTIQIDTTANFNSPLLRETTVAQSGGVVSWENPPVSWVDSAVYYWRISVVPDAGDDPKWRNSSFVYIPNHAAGWNQSHYFQYEQDNYLNMGLDEDRSFQFVNDLRSIDITTGMGIPWYELVAYIDNSQVALSTCAGRGFVSFVFDPNTGIPLNTSSVGSGYGKFGDTYCSGQPSQPIIQWRTDNAGFRENLYNFIMDSIPEGYYFIAYTTLYNPYYDDWRTDGFGPTGDQTLYDALGTLGAVEVESLDTLSYLPAYVFMAQKGNPSAIQEVVSTYAFERMDVHFEIPGFWNEGNFTSPPIGPVAAWGDFEWSVSSQDLANTDESWVNIYGISPTGTESLLAYDLQSGDTTLSWIDAAAYPSIRLEMNARDDSLRTAPQLDFWRVSYSPVPEAALNPSAHFELSHDTVYQGETVDFAIAIDNISSYDMDSLLVHYRLITEDNNTIVLNYPRQDSLLSSDRLLSSISIESTDLPSGDHFLFVEVNPSDDQPEQTHFNNIALMPLRVVGDNTNPFLDVTFDGQHILDGDIVSAEPYIQIRLKDENAFVALDDTSLLSLKITHPDGTISPVRYSDPSVVFLPAAVSAEGGSENRAELQYTPLFTEDGEYMLTVSATDVAGNKAGEIDYTISFEVITKSMISNVLNYPNPFSTRTQFVFTLTGAQVPEYYAVQIMSVSGRVVREIGMAELGPIHVGRNRTDFWWDGTDNFGDPLANGTYLYRFITRIGGQRIDDYATSVDQYFKNGWGKMYLAR